MHSIFDIQLLEFTGIYTPEALLTVYQVEKNIPFPIKRVFTINATQGCKRGFHAHKQCTQLLAVLAGECRVTCDDGEKRVSYTLSSSAEGLLIPPSIWAEQEYEANTILMVLTDRPYEEEDYIRDYGDFLEYRKSL